MTVFTNDALFQEGKESKKFRALESLTGSELGTPVLIVENK